MHLDEQSTRERLRDQRGFTLVEGAVAGLLMLIGLIGGISVFESSGHESATGERQQIASDQAQVELERLRDLPYDALATPDSSWPASGQPGDPTARVGGSPTSFEWQDGSAEELAIAAGGAVAPYSEVEIPNGSSTLTLGVYRFISWRDENCPVLASGVSGSLQGLTQPVTSLLSTLLGAGSVLNNLLGPLLGILNPIVGNRLDFARGLLTQLTGQVEGLADMVEELEGLEIDPCDADVAVLAEAQDLLESLSPMLTLLNSRINAYNAGCLKVLGIVVSCPGSSSSLFTSLNSTITNIQNEDFETKIADLIDSLDGLGLVDHPYNTKRVTIAVVLDPRTGTGPTKPVWATSVITDPTEGLLAG